jgi:hypothetical protein
MRATGGWWRHKTAGWCEHDLLFLADMLRRGGSVSEIASFVCRSEREVRDKAKELGLRSVSPPSRRVCAASPRSRFQSDRDRTRRRRAARWEQR